MPGDKICKHVPLTYEEIKNVKNSATFIMTLSAAFVYLSFFNNTTSRSSYWLLTFCRINFWPLELNLKY